MKSTIRMLAVVSACVLTLAGCSLNNPPTENAASGETQAQSEQTETKQFFAMDTYMTITATGTRAQEAVSAAVDEIYRLDNLLSVGNENSEITQINRNGAGSMSPDVQAMMEKSMEIFRSTEGAYDITVYPLMVLWGFTGDAPALPESRDIEDTLKRCGSEQLKISGSELVLGEGQGIDLGSIAKGYASAKIMQIFEEYGIRSGVVSLGGNVQCYHTKPDGTLWRCGITDPEHPESTDSFPGIVSVSDKAVITSGDYERFFIDENTQKRYHHIMDPETGYPAENSLRSVSVVSADGTLADALSTACFVMGKEKALDYWSSNRDSFDLVLIEDDGSITITEGIADNFSSDRAFTVWK